MHGAKLSDFSWIASSALTAWHRRISIVRGEIYGWVSNWSPCYIWYQIPSGMSYKNTGTMYSLERWAYEQEWIHHRGITIVKGSVGKDISIFWSHDPNDGTIENCTVPKGMIIQVDPRWSKMISRTWRKVLGTASMGKRVFLCDRRSNEWRNDTLLYWRTTSRRWRCIWYHRLANKIPEFQSETWGGFSHMLLFSRL